MPDVEAGKELVRKLIIEHWTSTEGISSLADYVTADYVHHAPMADVGFDGFVAGLKALRSAFPDLKYAVTHVFGDGELYAAHLRCSGTNTGPFGTMAPTGKALNATGIYHCRIVEGRVAEDWDAWTALGMPGQVAAVLRLP